MKKRSEYRSGPALDRQCDHLGCYGGPCKIPGVVRCNDGELRPVEEAAVSKQHAWKLGYDAAVAAERVRGDALAEVVEEIVRKAAPKFTRKLAAALVAYRAGGK